MSSIKSLKIFNPALFDILTYLFENGNEHKTVF